MDYKQYTIEDLEFMNEEILDVLVQRLIDEDIENSMFFRKQVIL